jgi:hypothetical protein
VHESNAKESLYSYLYLKLANALCLSYYFFCLLFNKIGEEGRTGSELSEGVWGGEEGCRGKREEMAQTMYAHTNK